MTVLTPLTEKDYEGLKRILRSLQVCYTIINIFIICFLFTSIWLLMVYWIISLPLKLLCVSALLLCKGHLNSYSYRKHKLIILG